LLFKSGFEFSSRLFINDENHCSLTIWEVNKAKRRSCDDFYVCKEKKNYVQQKNHVILSNIGVIWSSE